MLQLGSLLSLAYLTLCFGNSSAQLTSLSLCEADIWLKYKGLFFNRSEIKSMNEENSALLPGVQGDCVGSYTCCKTCFEYVPVIESFYAPGLGTVYPVTINGNFQVVKQANCPNQRCYFGLASCMLQSGSKVLLLVSSSPSVDLSSGSSCPHVQFAWYSFPTHCTCRFGRH